MMRTTTTIVLLGTMLLGIVPWTSAQSNAPNTEDDVTYVAEAVAVEAGKRQEFLALLRGSHKRLWASLVSEALLDEHRVFELIHVAEPTWQEPMWSYLFLARLPHGVNPNRYLAALTKKRLGLHDHTRDKFGGVARIRRVEVLVSTPNSHHPTPSAHNETDETEVFHWIEYIAVEPTQTALEEYRESMRLNSGPALRELVDSQLTYRFVALETVSVVRADCDMPSWNQIHFNGFVPPWHNGVFERALDDALRRVNPSAGGFERVFGRLDEIRTHTRTDLVKELLFMRQGR
jgi:hypothetical protein